MTGFRKSILREDGYLLGGLTAIPLGLWLLAGVVVGRIEPAPVERWGSPHFVLLPFLLLGEFVVYRFYAGSNGAPEPAFRDARGIAMCVGGLALVYVATTSLSLGQGAAVAAVTAWFGILLLVLGHGSPVHVRVGCALVVVGLSLLLPLPVNPSDVALVPLGLGSIICGLHEHGVYMRRHAPRSELGGER